MAQIGRTTVESPMVAMGVKHPGHDSKQQLQKQIFEEIIAEGMIDAGLKDKLFEIVDAPSPNGGMPGPQASPFDTAAKQGLISEEASKKLSERYFELSHGKGVLCSGSAEHIYDGVEITIDGEELSTIQSGYNVIKAVNGAHVTLKNVTLKKSGSSSHHECSFTGYNAGILAEGGVVDIEDSYIVSDATNGNNLFAHGEGSVINLRNCKLDAYGEASNRTTYCSWGGELNIENCELTTRGVTSAVIVTDTGGGTIRVKDSALKLMGRFSGCIYSTGQVYIDHCRAVANEWEVCVIVGNNAVYVKDSYLFSSKNQGVKVFTKEGDGATFVMEGGLFAVCEGPVLFTTGNHAHFTLRNVQVSNPDGIAFMADKQERGGGGPGMPPMPGQSAVNDMYVDLYQQHIKGDTICDDAHTVTVNLHEGSEYYGAVNSANTAAAAKLTLDEDSMWYATGESWLDVLTDEDKTLFNIVSEYDIHYDAANPENAWLNGDTYELAGGGMLMPK